MLNEEVEGERDKGATALGEKEEIEFVVKDRGCPVLC
jgi:hypothetical protein